MQKFELDLTKYEVDVYVPAPTEENPHAMGKIKQTYPLRENISSWLRSVGVFKSAEDVAEAVGLAKEIRNSAMVDSLELDEREAGVLKQAVNRLVELTAEGKANLGGEIHEDAIVRVMRMKEVK
jgi:hypothetical protein